MAIAMRLPVLTRVSMEKFRRGCPSAEPAIPGPSAEANLVPISAGHGTLVAPIILEQNASFG